MLPAHTGMTLISSIIAEEFRGAPRLRGDDLDMFPLESYWKQCFPPTQG